MKRMILFALFLNAAILGVIALELVALAGGDEDPTAAVNGDTNGDGARDIGDAVYLLRWLFNGGDEPVPVACAQAGPVLTAEQAEILSHLSLAQVPIDNQGTLVPTIIITGANLQLVNGMGSSWGDSEGDVWDPSTHRINGTFLTSRRPLLSSKISGLPAKPLRIRLGIGGYQCIVMVLLKYTRVPTPSGIS